MLTSSDDTICAPATPPGAAGIGVIRVSGQAAFQVADRILKHARPSQSYKGYTIHRAQAISANRGEPVDEVLVSVFHAPRSYTGEDMVEISCHGGPLPMRQTLQALLDAGARSAEPGEFTFRAFMNGKLDLAQAEAVCDLIEARTDEAHRAAMAQHDGRLSEAIRRIRDVLLGVLARIEASIDFPEDVGDLDVALCRSELLAASDQIAALLNTASRGILYREGARVVLAGRPNVGKSSLMNALLRTSRAIVTAIPGTTRDVIEETLNLQGVPVTLVDTAGVRETDDEVEKLGVELARSTMRAADLVLAVVDSSQPLQAADRELLEQATFGPCLIVANKSDLVSERAAMPPGSLAVSATTGDGLDALEDAIASRLLGGASPAVSGAMVTHARHRNSLARARDCIADAFETIAAEMPPDFLAIDVRGAIGAVEDVTGRSTADDIINEIFSRFCIGK